MSLCVVTFTAHSGSRYQCRCRATAVADHSALAVQKLSGAACYGTWVPGSDSDGRV